METPNEIVICTRDGRVSLEPHADGSWHAAGLNAAVQTISTPDGLVIRLHGEGAAVKHVFLRWNISAPRNALYLADHWERGYGDLEWRGLIFERLMPWYFLRRDSAGTHGYGVKTGTGALCHWQVDAAGITLVLDVRSGGQGVELGSRVLEAATVVCRPGRADESPFDAARAFSSLMCPNPKMPREPVYGGNNWYYAYGKSSHDQILRDSQFIARMSPASANRPYMVIDDGWQPYHSAQFNGGPWDHGNDAFPDMPGLAREMRAAGVKPGIWIRPLFTRNAVPQHWRLDPGRFCGLFAEPMLDPSVPEAMAAIAEDMRRINGWGYELIKHDFTTYDLCGRWGFAMADGMTPDGWAFAVRTRTTAEIILQLYRTIREAAGSSLVLGCNTIGHLAAGIFELQRTGDDTSGREWERTRKMGINTLAFRMCQHGTFFAVDADCVGLTNQVPWIENRQWLDLLSRSGTPLFVSADPSAMGTEQTAALREAFARGCLDRPPSEPLDWLETTCPRIWRSADGDQTYDWSVDPSRQTTG